MYRKLQHDRSFCLDAWATCTWDVGFRFLARAGEHPVRDAWGLGRNECTDAEADKILLAFMHIASLVDYVYDHRLKKVCAKCHKLKNHYRFMTGDPPDTCHACAMWHRLFGNQCVVCHELKSHTEISQEAEGPVCFTCRPFVQRWTCTSCKENKQFEDFQPRRPAAQHPGMTRHALNHREHRRCSACYTCRSCHQEFESLSSMQIDQPYCKECYLPTQCTICGDLQPWNVYDFAQRKQGETVDRIMRCKKCLVCSECFKQTSFTDFTGTDSRCRGCLSRMEKSMFVASVRIL